MSDAQLFEDTFVVNDVNDEKYDRVSRITATSTDKGTALTLDVNTELYPVYLNDTVTIALTSTLNLDGSKDDSKGWREPKIGEQTLADEYDYVCHGKVYRFMEGEENDTMKVFVSFGGLLLYLEGPYRKLSALRIDHVYLLMKK